MFRFVYTGVFLIALPFIFARLWWKEKKVPGYRVRWAQRLGVFKALKTDKPVIWVHAVSVGEVIAASALIHELLKQKDTAVMVTTMTPTGSDRVSATFGDQVEHVYAPFDLPWTVAAFLRRVKPVLTVIIETEIWPNMLAVCARKKVPLVLANARLSARSAHRYGYFPKTTRRVFNWFDTVAVQNKADGERFLKLGLAPEKLIVIGSVKFDISIPGPTRQAAQLLRQEYSFGGSRPVLIAASTHEGEERQVLAAFSEIVKTHPQTLLLIVPRHPDRFNDVHELCVARFNTVRRSEKNAPGNDVQVVLGDTMGEMLLLFGCADIAFMGGSLIDRGGHNMIEPATWGVPVLTGPHTFNFDDISRRLVDAGGMQVVNDADALAEAVNALLNDPKKRAAMGANALAFTESNRGAVARLMDIINVYTGRYRPRIKAPHQA